MQQYATAIYQLLINTSWQPVLKIIELISLIIYSEFKHFTNIWK